MHTLTFAFAITSLAVLLGAWLLAAGGGIGGGGRLGRLRRGWVGAIHGVCGAAGLSVVLLTRVRGGLHGQYGTDVLWLLAAGLAAGLVLADAAIRHRRPPDAVVVLHVTLAGIGYLILAGFALG